jgi:mono/diheme cytochrome c family protein
MALPVALGLNAVCLTAVLALAARKPRKMEGPAGQLSKAPNWAHALPNPYEGQADAAAAGRKLFERHCAACHGPEGRGRERAVDLHSALIQEAPPGVVFWALRNGRIRKGMPSWSALPDQQIWQIVTYLKTLK